MFQFPFFLENCRHELRMILNSIHTPLSLKKGGRSFCGKMMKLLNHQALKISIKNDALYVFNKISKEKSDKRSSLLELKKNLRSPAD